MRRRDADAQLGARQPSQSRQPADIEQLLRGAGRPVGIVLQLPERLSSTLRQLHRHGARVQ